MTSTTCRYCSSPVRLIGVTWVHDEGELLCSTADGWVAQPGEDIDDQEDDQR